MMSEECRKAFAASLEQIKEKCAQTCEPCVLLVELSRAVVNNVDDKSKEDVIEELQKLLEEQGCGEVDLSLTQARDL